MSDVKVNEGLTTTLSWQDANLLHSCCYYQILLDLTEGEGRGKRKIRRTRRRKEEEGREGEGKRRGRRRGRRSESTLHLYVEENNNVFLY